MQMINIQNLIAQNLLLRDYVFSLQRLNEQKNQQLASIKNFKDNKQYERIHKGQINDLNEKLKTQIQTNNILIEERHRLKFQIDKTLKEKQQGEEIIKRLSSELGIMSKNLKNELFKSNHVSSNNSYIHGTHSKNPSEQRISFGSHLVSRSQSKGKNNQDQKSNKISHVYNFSEFNVRQNTVHERDNQIEIQLYNNQLKNEELFNKISMLQEQIRQKQQVIVRKQQKIEEIQRNKEQLTKQINELHNRYQNLVQEHKNDLYRMSQSDNKKINVMICQLEKHKQTIEQLKVQQERISIKANNLETQKERVLLTQIQQKEGIIQFLKEENHSLHQTSARIKEDNHKLKEENHKLKEQNTSILSYIKLKEKGFSENTNSLLKVNNKNINYKHFSPEVRSTQPDKRNIENQGLKGLNIKNSPCFTQLSNTTTTQPYYPTKKHNTNYSPRDFAFNFQANNNKDFKKHTPNITWDNRTLNLLNLDSSSPPKPHPNTTKHLSRPIIKPVTQVRPNKIDEPTLATSAHQKNNYNAHISFINTLIEELPQNQHQLNQKWDQVQKKLIHLRKANSNLKKTLFD